MAKDFGSGQGGKQSISSTERSPKESGLPKAGIQTGITGESDNHTEVGPGVPANTRKIR